MAEDTRGQTHSVTVVDDDRPEGLLATWAQVKAHFWLRRRVGYGLTLRNPSMNFDLARHLRSIPMVALVVLLVMCAGAYVYSMIRPAGRVGDSRVVMDRSSGRIYLNANGLLYPTLNLASARLIVGSATEPVGVSAAAVAERPQGPVVGIPGAPDEMAVTNGEAASVAVCQTMPLTAPGGPVSVAVLNGGIALGPRADRLSSSQAIIGSLDGRTYLIWDGRKSLIDPNDQIVLAALGIDRAAAGSPAPLTAAFANAVPSDLPLVAPVVPDAGAPAPWDLGAVGAVVQSELPGRGQRYFLVLKDGVQEVSETVAAMLRAERAFGSSTAPVVDPDVVARAPAVSVVPTAQYPPGSLSVVDPRERPVTCWSWERGATASTAAASLISGTELPLAPGAVLSPVVGAHDGTTADAVYMGARAANWVRTTGNAPDASSQESWWWLAPSGSRFGVASGDRSRQALGLPDAALLMPWSVLSLFPSGLPVHVELSEADAKAQHENLPADPAPRPLAPAQP